MRTGEASAARRRSVPVGEIERVRVDQVFIGSCTNARIEDLRVAAHVLGENRIAPGVRTMVIPATKRVWQQANSEGLLDRFTEAGAGVWGRVIYHRGEATAALRRVGGVWDIVYNDIDKHGYPDAWRAARGRVAEKAERVARRAANVGVRIVLREIDERTLGVPGPITQTLQQKYFAIVKGEDEKYADWLDFVR